MDSSHHSVAPVLSAADFGLVAESIPQVVWMAAADGSTVSFNHRGTEYAGLARTAKGSSWLALVHPADADRAALVWREAVSTGNPYEIECRLRRADGAFRWQACSALPVHGSDGGIVGWMGTFTEIEDRHRLAASLRASEREGAESLSLLETIQSSAPVGLGFVDREFRVIRMNEALAATNGIPSEQQLGRTVEETIPSLWPQLGPIYERVLETGEAAVNLEATGDLGGDPGREHTWLTSLYPVRLAEEVIGIGIVTVDITERKEAELKLKWLSEHDPLTGIYNRRQFLVELQRVLRYAARYGHAGAVLMLDVDNFKLTNDTYGHAVGDQQLNAVAQLLVGRLRDTDIVGRLGGDEFAVVLPEATEEQALTVASLLRSQLRERLTGPPVRGRVGATGSSGGAAPTASVGIALFSGDVELTADDVLGAADVAMYGVKEAGGDQAAVFTGRTGDLMSRVAQLRQAIAEKRFVLHTQPIIELHSNRVAHHELLIRMIADNGETIAPGNFIPLAERFSLMGEIDRWVVGEALALARQMPVAANLSARSIGDPQILKAVSEAIANGLDPRNLIFEITETAATIDLQRAQAFVAALTELGCGLALDDFGTGFGSFSYLKHLPARYLKIDMEFVRDINDDPTDREIVRSITGIAHTLGKEIIAEGVESAAVLDTLRELGVDYAQGFYLGKPERHLSI